MMDEPPEIVEQILEALVLPDGQPDRLRRVHTIGIGATGFFVPSDIARDYCIAEHFAGDLPVPVTVRFSNGLGSPHQHDGWAGEAKGMATRFHLKNGAATDLIAMTLPSFFPSPEIFLDLLGVAKPERAKARSPWQKICGLLKLEQPTRDPFPGEVYWTVPGASRFADANASSQVAVAQASLLEAPSSYARAIYHAVHAFKLEGPAPAGVQRWVRFSWRPVAGVHPCTAPVDDYLQPELRERLAREPARFTLMIEIGEAGDDVNDSSRPWPPHRSRVVMGELTLDTVPDDQINRCERMSFNPMLLVDGIAASDDPVLHLRRQAYQDASRQRGGAACPFSGV